MQWPPVIKIRNRSLVLFLLLGMMAFWACKYDQDAPYYVRTQAMFFLVENPPGDISVSRIDSSGIRLNWEQTLDLQAGAISDLDGKPGFLWLADVASGAIHKVNPGTGQIEESFSTGNLLPHRLAVGEIYMMFGDTVADKIGLIRIRNGKTEIFDAGGKPGMIRYRSQKFYYVTGQDSLTLFHEKALARMLQTGFERPIRDMQFDEGRHLHIYTAAPDSNRLYEATIDLNADALDQPESLPDPFFRKARLSPYNYAPFGREFTQDLFQRQNRLFLGSGAPVDGIPSDVDDFEMDFFESVVYYVSGDSLRRFDLVSGEQSLPLLFSDRILKSYVYASEVGK
jgi:hypothetical protein